ncbi:unnamed protein product [Didymodactylos carnosus]|uniref:Uncharacterized protein n=2 Tax=Didymodactylos carnosus TaxID=1234261 RepID=A0A813VIU0_9BILA|nr:unnamed protein product [Didymodactylos carnosus]CAF3626449.1 unnamed protein product [Didymodactylos carnosus]
MFLVLVLMPLLVTSLELDTCRAPLGMQSGSIPDVAIQASSSLDSTLGPQTARIRSSLEGGGWCPKQMIDSESNEYLEISFNNLTVITLIETQGRHGLFQEDYVNYYRLEYKRENNLPWIKYKDYRKKEILYGNSNNNIAEIREITPPITVMKLRFIPTHMKNKKKRMCLRLELYGCQSSDHVISYTIPQGEQRTFDMEFLDDTYDGVQNNGMLTDGMGQLFDGETGTDDYRTDSQSLGIRGYEWIGWKKESQPIDIIFYFDDIRNFTELLIHTNNMYTKDVQVFRRINISTSLDTQNYKQNIIIIDLSDDRQSENARYIHIPLQNNVAKSIKISLTFASKWILISEVKFHSLPIKDKSLLTSLSAISSSSLSTTTTVVIPLQFIIILAATLSIIIIFILLCFTILILKHRKKQKLNRYGEKLILQTCYSDNPLKLQIPEFVACCNLDKDTQSSGRSQSSYGASSDPSTFTTPKTTARKCIIGSIQEQIPLSSSSPPPLLPQDTNFYASTDIVTVNENTHLNTYLRGICGNNLMLEYLNMGINMQRKIEKIKNEQIQFGETFGEGRFGQIFIGRTLNSNKYVLIRKLVKVSYLTRSLFEQETRLLETIVHENIAGVLYKTHDDLSIITEYTDLGDLCLLMHRISQNDKTARLDHSAILFITSQISAAMSYLEMKNIIHRDLATRNCLVFTNYLIKVTDCAMSTLHYSHHYCIMNDSYLPVRWMSPETLLNGEYSTKSDIWSFGITLYEILTMSHTLPYCQLSNDDVIRHIKTLADSQLPNLDTSSICSIPFKELTDLLYACLKRTSIERPSFHEINLFLHRQSSSSSTTYA